MAYGPGVLAALLLGASGCGSVVHEAPDAGGNSDAPANTSDAGASDASSDAASRMVSLTITLPVASGTVTSAPTGIACGDHCTASFPVNTQVVLTAAAGSGATFQSWGATCAGSSPTCTVTLTADTTVVATFATANYMFVTSTTSTGNLGGLQGADATCQARAQSVGLPGTYRAWLSTTSVNASARLGNASGWIRVDGKPFANTVNELAAGKFYYPPRVDENGRDLLGQRAYTATNGGTLQGGDCAGWTSTTAPEGAVIGSSASSGSGWTNAGGASCNSLQRLYCFGIDSAATVLPPSVSGGRRAFMRTWIPGGGLASADVACQTEAQTAGLTGTFKALLATSGASALSRFNLDGASWLRTDGVAILPTAQAWSTAQFFDTNPNLDVGNRSTFSGYVNWSGATSLTEAGTVSSTCNNWTDQAATAFGGTSDTNLLSGAPIGFFSSLSQQCNYSLATITCLQE